MLYQADLLEAIATNDTIRIEAIQRLNTPGSYIDGHDSESHDKLVAVTSIGFRRTHSGFYPNECY